MRANRGIGGRPVADCVTVSSECARDALRSLYAASRIRYDLRCRRDTWRYMEIPLWPSKSVTVPIVMRSRGRFIVEISLGTRALGPLPPGPWRWHSGSSLHHSTAIGGRKRIIHRSQQVRHGEWLLDHIQDLTAIESL